MTMFHVEAASRIAQRCGGGRCAAYNPSKVLKVEGVPRASVPISLLSLTRLHLSPLTFAFAERSIPRQTMDTMFDFISQPDDWRATLEPFNFKPWESGVEMPLAIEIDSVVLHNQ